MTAERTIHVAIFCLLLVGLFALTGWINYRYVDDIILKFAGVALSWGAILLALYLIFNKMDWHWWS